MKKFWLVIFMLFLITVFSESVSLCNFCNNKNAKVTFYTTQPFFNENAKTIKNGNVFLVSCNTKNIKTIFNKLNKNLLKGQSVCFYGTENDLHNFVKRYAIGVVSTEQLQSIFVVNGFNLKFGKGVVLGEDIINIQLAFNNGLITIGCPTILGSF